MAPARTRKKEGVMMLDRLYRVKDALLTPLLPRIILAVAFVGILVWCFQLAAATYPVIPPVDPAATAGQADESR